ncbi:universal stress protein [Ancylobacter lacus]|uniref:universal stress protein n=1 Tax=Ancylobacter lacus TaxID=2579970 RepID=UPI001BCB6C1E|nr:universal stress protein [Ancylobacter lacus]MBS7541356.1 universal stress protein [Ancylobacter lacus]
MIANLKSILAGTTEEGGERPSSAVGYALGLASAAQAHLTVQAASLKMAIPFSAVGQLASDIVTSENRRLHELAEAVARDAGRDAEQLGVSCSLETPHLPFPDLVEAFLHQARVHDVAVLDAFDGVVDLDRVLAERVLFESGRPVIAVPVGYSGFRCRRIIVAWDGSGVAARAVADALPLLRAADQVEIVSVVGEKDIARAVPGAELAPHLIRHGVTAEVKSLRVGGSGDVAEVLRDQASLFHADLIVMGAYRHSRLQEILLGGVTRSLLGASPVPLFLSH